MKNKLVVSVIDYGMGNIGSVANAIEAVGNKVLIASNRGDILNAKALILPGVGAYGAGMRNLISRNMDTAIVEAVIANGTPLLGICLGMQLLGQSSDESVGTEGLGLIKGHVERVLEKGNAELRYPHIGWNEVTRSAGSILFSRMDEKEDFYFVHGYAFKSILDRAITSSCTYGGEFIASIEMNNIFATQFHPEKSHTTGIQLIKNWIDCSEQNYA